MNLYLVEYHLIPARGRQHPLTRRHLIEADSIGSALLLFVDNVAPGHDCTEIRVVDVDSESLTTDTE